MLPFFSYVLNVIWEPGGSKYPFDVTVNVTLVALLVTQTLPVPSAGAASTQVQLERFFKLLHPFTVKGKTFPGFDLNTRIADSGEYLALDATGNEYLYL